MWEWLPFLVGLFIGLAAMWLFDWWFYGQRGGGTADSADLRQKIAAAESARDDFQQRHRSAESRLEATSTDLVTARADAKEAQNKLTDSEERLAVASNNLKSANIEIEALRARLEACNRELTSAQSNLSDSNASPAPAVPLAASMSSSHHDELDDMGATLTMPTATAASTRDNLKRIHGIGPKYERLLNDADIYTFSMLASLTPQRLRDIIQPKDWQFIDPESWIEQARIFIDAPTPEEDELQLINGIGPIYSRMLHDAGIHTFSDLARQSVSQVEKVINPDKWQRVNAAAWIDEARMRATD